MATLRGCSCCVNQGVGGFTLPSVLCCKLFTHHCPATSHSHCPTTSHSHCPTTSHSHCPISLLDTVLARQPYCSCPPRGQCVLFRNWALSPGVVLNLKVGCMTRRLREFWKCTVICRFLEHTCTLYMYMLVLCTVIVMPHVSPNLPCGMTDHGMPILWTWVHVVIWHTLCTNAT